MVALSTPESNPDPRGDLPVEKLRLLRELGAQAVPAWAALESLEGGKARVVVVERARRKAFGDAEIADWIRDARRLQLLDHPNVARVRDVVIRGDEVLVVSDFVDGVRWSEWGAGPRPPPLESALRVFVDALSGLSALHGMRDEKRQPLQLAHAGLTPDCIVVGSDGTSRIVGASRPRSAAARLAGSGSPYLAPEVLLEDDSADAKADVYSVGVMLWEALSQRRFLPNLPPSAIVTQLLGGRVPPVVVSEATPWAAPLADVVTRALSPDPAKRYPSAAAMTTDLRRVASTKLPMAVRVATAVRTEFAEAIQSRRQDLERGEVRSSEVTRRGSFEELAVEITLEPPEASHTASTAPPPPPSAPVAIDAATSFAVVTVPAFEPMPLALDSAPALAPASAPDYASALAPMLARAGDDDPQSTTATPLAIATEGVALPARASRPRGIVMAAGALVAVALITWLLVSRGSSVDPATVDPLESATAPASAGTPGSPPELPVANTPATQALAPPAEARALPTPIVPETIPAATSAPPVPPRVQPAAASPAAGSALGLPSGPSKRRPTATPHGYDPQGI